MDPDPIVDEDTPTDPDSPPAPISAWTLSSHKGSWVSGSTAGGSCTYPRECVCVCFQKQNVCNFIYLSFTTSLFTNPSSIVGSFWKNPQFQLTLAEHDDDNAMTPEEKKVAGNQKEKAKQCTVLVELLQKNRRKKDKISFLHIAFHIYRVREEGSARERKCVVPVCAVNLNVLHVQLV